MVKSLKNQNDDVFFVKIRDPIEVRRNILENLKNILEILQRFEKLRHIRQGKLENMQKLSVLLKQANKMLGNLRTMMPQTNLKAIAPKETLQERKVTVKKKERKEKVSEKISKKEMTDIEKLEVQLNAIESKLKSLG